MCKILRVLDSIFLGSVGAMFRANHTVQTQLEDFSIEKLDGDHRLKCTREQIEDDLEYSIRRLERIESKAMSTVLGVAVALAVFGAASGLFGSEGVFSQGGTGAAIVAVLVILALAYLFGSGFLALAAYSVGRVYRPTLSDRLPTVSEEDQKTRILFAIEQNHRIGTLRSNRLSVCFNLLRNGLAVVLLLGIAVILLSLVAQSSPEVGANEPAISGYLRSITPTVGGGYL